MEFTIKKVQEHYDICEGKNTVFTIDYVNENKLLSLYLRNMYGDEVLGFYQIKKWYSGVRASRTCDFTLYEKDVKLGELHPIKDGFELIYHDVLYRFYCGDHAGKRTLAVYDREEQVANMVMGEETVLCFQGGSFSAMLALSCILMKDFLPQEKFTQAGFMKKYTGIYKQK